MPEPVELNEFLAKDFGMSFSVSCNECGQDVTNVTESDEVVALLNLDGSSAVDDDAVVLVAIHECENSEIDDEDDDEMDDDDDED